MDVDLKPKRDTTESAQQLQWLAKPWLWVPDIEPLHYTRLFLLIVAAVVLVLLALMFG